MEYYYADKENINEAESTLIIDDFEYKHLAKVLRKKPGDLITMTDGCRNIYHCRIENIDSKKIYCNILSKEFNKFESEINLTLCISLLRNQDRFEFAIEKAVELGVNSIQHVTTEFTVNKNILSESKVKRLQKIITGAMGQSQRCVLPELRNKVNLDELVYSTSNIENKIVMYESSEISDNTELKAQFNRSKECFLLIGPEGGFSNKEISLLKNNNWKIRSLGDRKLRAETAAIVSVFDLLTNI